VGSKTSSNVGRQSCIIEKITWLFNCSIICVKNKLFKSVKTPHEPMHQPNSMSLMEASKLRSNWDKCWLCESSNVIMHLLEKRMSILDSAVIPDRVCSRVYVENVYYELRLKSLEQFWTNPDWLWRLRAHTDSRLQIVTVSIQQCEENSGSVAD
jgi:hypothetical protein